MRDHVDSAAYPQHRPQTTGQRSAVLHPANSADTANENDSNMAECRKLAWGCAEPIF